MTGALVLTAALMGLAGTPHCAGMCGAGCAAAVRLCGGSRPSTTLASLMAGRLLAYVLAGMVVATVAAGLQSLSEGTGWLRPMWVGLQMLLLVLGLSLLLSGRLPRSIEAWLERSQARPQDAAVTRKVHLPGELKAAGVGLLWPVLPCGLLHGALLVAAVASGPLEGGVVMLAFGLTSMLGLLVGPYLWLRLIPGRLRERAARDQGEWSLRLAGAMIVAVSGWTLAHAVMDPILAWCA